MRDPECLPHLSGTEHGGERLTACLRLDRLTGYGAWFEGLGHFCWIGTLAALLGYHGVCTISTMLLKILLLITQYPFPKSKSPHHLRNHSHQEHKIITSWARVALECIIYLCAVRVLSAVNDSLNLPVTLQPHGPRFIPKMLWVPELKECEKNRKEGRFRRANLRKHTTSLAVSTRFLIYCLHEKSFTEQAPSLGTLIEIHISFHHGCM